jgi:hypothetical protein
MAWKHRKTFSARLTAPNKKVWKALMTTFGVRNGRRRKDSMIKVEPLNKISKKEAARVNLPLLFFGED